MTHVGKDGSVEFRFLRPAAQAVALAGDFNGWTPAIRMHRDDNGWWAVRLAMEPGDYRFRYVADGKWYTDFASNGVEFSAEHGWNSMLVVPGKVSATPVKAGGLQYGPHGDALKVA